MVDFVDGNQSTDPSEDISYARPNIIEFIIIVCT